MSDQKRNLLRGSNRAGATLRMIARRLASSVLLLCIMSVLVFAATQALPGDIAQMVLGRDSTPEQVDRLRSALNLDAPVWRQYLIWAGNLLQGDFGVSFVSRQPVFDILQTRLSNTVVVVLLSFLISIPLSLVLGVYTAVNADRVSDRVILFFGIALNAMPEFVLALLLVLLLSVQVFHVFPGVALLSPGVSIWMQLPKIALPVLTLALLQASYFYRLVRATMIDVLASDYVEFARLKGMPRRNVLWRQAVPNALVPAVQAAGTIFAISFGGVVVIEYVFAFPGLGTALADAVGARDIKVVQAITLTIALIFFATNIVTDLITMALTPPGRGGVR